ncbi:DUF1731 domain-containing protein, partial [Streptomyces edwardsiae]
MPALGPRVLLGDQGARELACASQRAVPAVLTAADHHVRPPRLDQARRHVLGRAITASELPAAPEGADPGSCTRIRAAAGRSATSSQAAAPGRPDRYR